ncbi:MAG TPA: TIGR02757 family protein [Ignavibacteria bacterium]|nr:TIGR02757 family protein [Ignavibacteria bacterium]
MNYSKLKIYLEDIYSKYKHKHSSKDPVWILHNCKNDLDVEALGLVVSCFSYGNINQINNFINSLIKISGLDFSDFILNFNRKKELNKLQNLYYRFNNSEDLVLLILNLQRVLKTYGSLRNLILKIGNNGNVTQLISGFANELKKFRSDREGNFDYLLPDPINKSTCKRLNLYLRWMVRSDEIDLGVWKDLIDKSNLIMPVDTHIYKVSRDLKMVKRKSCDLKYALELTEVLKKFDPTDPIRFDFAMCHIRVK